MALFIALSVPIIQALYGRGEFGEQSIAIASNALTFYSLGMLSFAIAEILNRTFFAVQDGKIPMLAAISGVLANLSLSAYLMFVQGFGVGALALSAAFGITVTAIILLISIAIRKRGILNCEFAANLFKTLICGTGTVVTAVHSYSWLSAIFIADDMLAVLLKFILASSGALVVYLVLCWIFQIEEQKGLLSKLFRR